MSWALDGRYIPQRKREKAIVVVAGPHNPCSVIALEGKVVAHIGDIGVDEPTARNATASICQYVVDAMAVADLWPYTFVIDGWRNAPNNEAAIEFLIEDSTEGYFYHPVFETLESVDFSVFQDSRYLFPELLYGEGSTEILLDVNFRKAMFFLSSALRYSDHTSAFCIQAVEAIRAAFGEGSDKESRKAVWRRMHQALDTKRFALRVLAPEYQSEKHGMSVPRSWLERARVLGPAIETAYRYALYWSRTRVAAGSK